MGSKAGAVFDINAAGDEVSAEKPAPDVYLLALERLDLPAEACIAVEDSTNGLRAARAAGLRVLVTPSGYTLEDRFDGATWVIDDLSPDTLPADLLAGFRP